MPTLKIDVRELECRILELLDAVIDGRRVEIIHLGRVVGVCGLLGAERQAPPAWVAAALVQGLDEMLEHFREHGLLPSWRLN